MATNFPGGIDTFPPASPTSGLDNPSHSGLHNDLGDGLTAVQTELVNNPIGVVLIKTATFSASSAESLDDVFSATYDNYRVVFNMSAKSTTGNLKFRLRVSGADNNASNYFWSLGGNTPASTYFGNGAASDTSFTLSRSTNSNDFVSLDIFNPFKSNERTHFFGNGYERNQNSALFLGGMYAADTSFTSITFFPSAGNFTGTYSVYGYRKS